MTDHQIAPLLESALVDPPVRLHRGRSLVVIVVSSPRAHAPLDILFDASSSLHFDERVVCYERTLSDGAIACDIQAEYTFQANGEYIVVLTVQDNRGAEDTATTAIEVTNPPPIALFTYSPQAPVMGQVLVFDASTSYDPAALQPTEVMSGHWNFGDGHEANGAVVQHIYMVLDEYTGTLTITDDGVEDITEEIVNVGLPAPPPPPG